LSLEEACLAWQAAASLGYPFGPVFRLMLLTGCRSGEWSACRRSYVDLEQKMLVIPASAYKTDHFHIVPLVPETRSAVQYRRPKDCLIETVMRELSGENCAFDPRAAGLLTPLRADTSQWKARLSGLRLRTCYMR